MVRLAIFAALLVACEAHHLGYNLRQRETYSPIFEKPLEEFTKSFYFFAPPEEEARAAQPIASRAAQNVKKNLQVIVIKAPEYNAQANAAANLAQQAIQTKTLVYVLSKQPNISDIERQLQQTQRLHRPEVRFVKYRTADEARRFQEAIQSQLGNLPGSFSSLNAAGEEVSTADDDDELYTARHPPFLPTGVDVVPGSSYLPPKRD